MNGAYYLRDLRSSNGTIINGKKVQGCVLLNPDDEIYLGRSVFLFCPSQKKLAQVTLNNEEAETINPIGWRCETVWDKITRKVLLIFRLRSADTLQDRAAPATGSKQLTKVGHH